MKKLTGLFLAIILALALAACTGEQPEPTGAPSDPTQGTEQPTEPAAEKNYVETPKVIHLETDRVNGGREDYSAFVNYDLIDDGFLKTEAVADAEKVIERINETIEKNAEGFLDDNANQGTYGIDARIIRADQNVLSLALEESDSRADGANVRTYNINMFTGGWLEIGDVVTDTDKFSELAFNRLNELFPDEETGISDAATLKHLISSGMPFSVSYTGVTLYTDINSPDFRCSLAVAIDFTEAPELFTDIVKAVPDEWISAMPGCTFTYADVNGDGSQDKIHVSTTLKDEYDRKYTIFCGEKSAEIDIGAWNPKNFLVKTGGKFYTYMFLTSDNDWPVLEVIDMADCSFNPEKSLSLRPAGYMDEVDREERTSEYKYFAITDPAEMILGTHIDAMGTYSGYAKFKAGNDGYPELLDETWTAISYSPITAKTEIKTATTDGKEVVIAPGSQYVVARTNAVTVGDEPYREGLWIDLYPLTEKYEPDEYGFMFMDEPADIPENAVYYRLIVNRDGWQWSVDGVPESELFDGIMYAG